MCMEVRLILKVERIIKREEENYQKLFGFALLYNFYRVSTDPIYPMTSIFLIFFDFARAKWAIFWIRIMWWIGVFHPVRSPYVSKPKNFALLFQFTV